MAGTVFTLNPAFFNVMNLAMQGTVQAGKTVVPIPYVNIPDPIQSPFDFNAQGGVKLLNNALTSGLYQKPYTVFAWSFGSQVACKWLREDGPTSAISPNDLSFILIGNPERHFGGQLGMMRAAADGSGMQSPTWQGGVSTPVSNATAQYVRSGQLPGIPAGNRYPVIDFARQYDYYADYPTVPDPNSAATSNASPSIHMNYFSVTLADTDLITFGPVNNVTYVWSPTAGGDEQIESAYQRPVTI